MAEEWASGLPYTAAWEPEFVTRNNRLLEYKVWGPPGSSGRPLLRTVRYTYYATGHASNITIKDEWTGTGDPPAEYARYHDLALYYASAGSLWLAANDSWTLDEQGEPVDYQVTAIREFRFEGGGGQRNMTRAWHWNVNAPGDTTQWTPDGSAVWTDSVAGLPYGDFEAHLDGNGYPVTAEAMRFLAGAGLHGQQTLDGENNPIRYFHGNLGGSTMMMTDEGATAVSAVSYTAFGEPVGDADALGTRYQYAGGYGYESGLISLAGPNADLAPITLQHVGARWYEAGTGRFDQRDPIGIEGGLNVYAYCDTDPVAAVDPDGTQIWPGIGEPSPANPTPYPRPPGGRIRIPPYVRVPPPPPSWKPSFPVTPRVGGQVALAACVGYVVGTGINNAPRLWGGRKISDRIGDWIGQSIVDIFGLGPPGYIGI